MTTATLSNTRPSIGKTANIALWSLQLLLGLAFAASSAGKLSGASDMVGLFRAIGLGQWFRYLTGILELGGAVALLVPRTRFYGAALLASVMLGAIATHVFVLQNAPTAAVVLFVLASVVAWGRRAEGPAFVR
jgi:putative oxidoreductase